MDTVGVLVSIPYPIFVNVRCCCCCFFFQRCCICVRECVVYYDKKNNKKRIKLKKHCTGNHDTSNRSNSQLLALFSLCHSNSSILIKWASDVSTTSKYSLECNVCRSNHKSQQNCFKRANIWKSFCFCFVFCLYLLALLQTQRLHHVSQLLTP